MFPTKFDRVLIIFSIYPETLAMQDQGFCPDRTVRSPTSPFLIARLQVLTDLYAKNEVVPTSLRYSNTMDGHTDRHTSGL